MGAAVPRLRLLVAAIAIAALPVSALAAPADAHGGVSRPAAPKHLKASAGAGTATLSWSAPHTSKSARVNRYRVARALTAKGKWTVVAKKVKKRKYVAKGLAAKPYYFRVAAHNRKGWGKWSKAARVVPRTTTPSAPTNLRASRTQVPAADPAFPPTWSIVVTWTPPGWKGASAVDSYRVERQVKGATSWSAVATTTQLTYSTAQSLGEESTHYLYRVTAHNSHGFGTPTVVALPATPDGPTFTHLTPADGGFTVSWTAPGDNGGSPITGYQLTWQRLEWPSGDPDGSQVQQFVAPSASSYQVTGLVNGGGAVYEITLRAQNQYGASPYTQSYVIPGVPYGTTVTAVTPTRTSPSAVDVAVTWTAATGDGGSALLGYSLQLWDADDADATTPVASFKAGADATGHTFSALALVPGHQYAMYVTPYNANNSGDTDTGYTSEKDFTAP